MTLEHQVRWVIHSVEPKHVDQLIRCGPIHGSEVLSSIAELDLPTRLEWNDLTEVLDLVVVVTDVHQAEAVTQAHDDVEPTGVE